MAERDRDLPGAPLAQVQAWFLTAMTAPGGAARGVELAGQRHGLQAPQVLKGAARLHIYADGYVLRLLECLQADYPVLRRVMGDALFGFFARAYIWRHPSVSTTLHDLGGGFADFLAASQARAGEGAQGAALRFPVELARLERARGEASRAPGLEKLPRPLLPVLPSGLALLLGQTPAWRLAPCTRLLALTYPVHAYWQQAQAAPDDAVRELARTPEVAALADRLEQRRLPLPQAEAEIADYAKSADNQHLTALMLAIFDRVEPHRAALMDGIARYGRKQVDLAARIEGHRHEMARLEAIDSPDFDAQEEQLDWDMRIFQDRQQALTYVCETPVILEQRVFALGRAIAAGLK